MPGDGANGRGHVEEDDGRAVLPAAMLPSFDETNKEPLPFPLDGNNTLSVPDVNGRPV